MEITIENKFLKFKSDFKSDTGLEFNKDNMGLYIQYVNVRCNDTSCQVLQHFAIDISNKLHHLPEQTRSQIAEMIKTHETIEKLLKMKS